MVDKDAPDTPPTDWEQEALNKAERYGRAQRRKDDSLYTLGQVGMLAWLFLVPVLTAGWIARVSLRDPAQRWLALPLLLIGVALGGVLVRRKVLALLNQKKGSP